MTYTLLDLLFGILGGLLLGLSMGGYLRDRIWRAKGDHDYMNRMESGGRLYTVKREY